jgi:hypothetical protein
MVEIYPARFPEQLEVVRAIFREYAESLGIDLSFQNFESELAELPGKFAAPGGAFFLLKTMRKWWVVLRCVLWMNRRVK